MGELATKSVAFSYGGVDVLRDSDGLISLTSMWKAQGSPTNQDPRQWRRKEGAGFIKDLAKHLDVPVGHIAKASKGGRGGGGETWAHWQVAIAYAKSLSHEFHRHVNACYVEFEKEAADPDLKADRAIAGYRRRGATNAEIAERIQGKLARLSLTDTLKEHEVEPGIGYAVCTDAVNVPILGAPAAAIKRKLGLPKTAATRDFLSASQLAAIRLAELLATDSIEKSDARGTAECRDICRHAGEAVGSALSQFRS